MPLTRLMARTGLVAAVMCLGLVALHLLLAQALLADAEIAYQDVGKNGAEHIYALDITRGFVVSLTDGRLYNAYGASWSPDGSRLALITLGQPNTSMENEIHIMDMTANQLHPFDIRYRSSTGRFFDFLSWSPQGERLAFGGRLDGQQGLFVADIHSGDMRYIGEVWSEGFWSVWSPDGSRIAFPGRSERGAGLYEVHADGSQLRLLSENVFQAFPQAWSPDGSQIVFSSFDGINVVTIDSDGIRERAIHSSGDLPAWSPTGDRIAFVSATYGDSIYTVSPDGSGLRLLASQPDWSIWALAWSPDGSQIAMQSDCYFGAINYPQMCLYLINGDGSGARLILIHNDADYTGWMAWRP